MFVFNTLEFDTSKYLEEMQHGLILYLSCNECNESSNVCLGFDLFDASQDFNKVKCPKCDGQVTILMCGFNECHYQWQGITYDDKSISDKCISSNVMHNTKMKYHCWKALIINVKPLFKNKEDITIFMRHPFIGKTYAIVVNKTNTIDDLFKIFIRHLGRDPTFAGSLRITFAGKSYRPGDSDRPLEFIGIREGHDIGSVISTHHDEFVERYKMI